MWRKLNYNNKYIHLAFSLLFINEVQSTGRHVRQNPSIPIEVAKCTEYKQTVFEDTRSFGFLIRDAEPETITIDNCINYTPFIVDGTLAKPKEFPHIARLGYAKPGEPTDWFCGGTLVSAKYVMTAAHCFERDVNRVRLGELDFGSNNDDAQPEDFNVQDIIPHPNFSDETAYDDIGLIELDRPVNFNRYIHPACLPTNNGDTFENFIAVGWGDTAWASGNSPKLYKVRLDRISLDRCKSFEDDTDKLASGINTRSQVCAGSTDKKDTCHGDSGGPLLAYHGDYPCMYFVVGITSFGISGCGTPGVPAVYTRVHNYIDWINTYIWK